MKHVIRPPHIWGRVLGVALMIAVSGCNESTTPAETATEGGVEFDGKLDPTGSSFVLKRLETPLPGRIMVRVDLVASNLRSDASQGIVSLDVAIRNAGGLPLHAAAILWLQRFIPASLTVANADLQRGSDLGPAGDSTRVVAWGFDYSDLLGDDAVLMPGETSARKTWIFRDPGLQSFSFAAHAQFGMQPDRPHISGSVFHDDNRNGRRDRGEGPFWGSVSMLAPSGDALRTVTDTAGAYRFPIDAAGLYELTYRSHLRDGEPDPRPNDPPEPTPLAVVVCVTTPNPLHVIVAAGPDGEPASFEHADFGVAPAPCDSFPGIPLLRMTDLQPGDLEQDPYTLIDAKLAGDVLSLRAGFSGCSPDHPFQLYASRGFMESNPVQTWALLVHDDRGELCDAWFERTLQFDLSPLRAEHIRAYGRAGVVVVRFRDSNGNETRFEFGP